MPWDPEPCRPTLQWPPLMASNPYILKEPEAEWTVVSDMIPLKTITIKRSKYIGSDKPDKISAAHRDAVCDHCHNDIYCPLFVCSCSLCVFWCWSCITNPGNEHPCEHTFIRVDGEKGSNLARRQYAAQAVAIESPVEVKCMSSAVVAGPSRQPKQPLGRPSGFRVGLKQFPSHHLSRVQSLSNIMAEQPRDLLSNANQDAVIEVTAEAKYNVILIP